MARKNQKGLTYFPMDVSFYDDDKIQLINAEFGTKGESITTRLLCLIYKNGYWYNYDNDKGLLLAKRVGNGVTGSLVSEVVVGLVKRSFFDKRIYDQFKILTSRGIQERFFEATERRKTIDVLQEIMLVDYKSNINLKNVTFNVINVTLIGENVTIGTQRKEEERENEKEIKVDEIETPSTPPLEIPPETEKKEPPPFAAAPPPIGFMWAADCLVKYFSDAYYERTIEQLCMAKHMDVGTLREWADAFCRYLTSSGNAAKTMDDFTRHFSNWLNRQPNLNINPKKLFSEYESGNTAAGANGASSNQSAFDKINRMHGKA